MTTSHAFSQHLVPRLALQLDPLRDDPGLQLHRFNYELAALWETLSI